MGRLTSKAQARKERFLGFDLSNQDEDRMAAQLTFKCVAINS
jgi:hypothetical protein